MARLRQRGARSLQVRKLASPNRLSPKAWRGMLDERKPSSLRQALQRDLLLIAPQVLSLWLDQMLTF